MPITTVLCPVDRSDPSRRALEYAIEIARHFKARLSVLEVIDAALPVFAVDPGTPLALRTKALEALTAFVADAGLQDVSSDVSVETGDVIPEILARATDISADLIVIGTHGRSGFERLALGSIAEKVIRRSSRPILTVPPAGAALSGRGFHTILCATDFSAPSARAFGLAVELAKRWGARILLAHVIEWPFGRTEGQDPVSELRRSLESTAREQLGQVAGRADRSGARIEIVLAAGSPRREIVALARGHAVDLVVLGVSGRGAMDFGVLGSTAYSVIREAAFPVLTVHAMAESEPAS